MSKVVVVCHGYLGDHLFASSLAKKLLEEGHASSVDYVVGFPQVIPLLKLNPYINNIIFDGVVTPAPQLRVQGYNKVIQLRPLSFVEQPCIEYQKLAGIINPTPDFTIYTDKDLDNKFEKELEPYRIAPVIAIMNNWQSKAFRFTEEEYIRGIDVPNKGYGGRVRNIPFIVSQLKERFVTIDVGAPDNITQFQTATTLPTQTRTLLEEASLLKNCDYFVGAEGGLANLASGVGCKTILTSDFVHQLYGWNGVIRKIKEPKLGPRYYFPNGHIDLNPYLSDEEVVEHITKIITGVENE